MIELIKGASNQVDFTAYTAPGVKANLTNAIIKLYLKKTADDDDGAALVVKTGVPVDAVNGVGKVNLDAIDTNTIAQTQPIMELIIKLETGNFIRRVDVVLLKNHVMKTLY